MNKEVKICGTSSTWDLDASIQAGADAIGIITDYHASDNKVTRQRAGWFIRSVPEGITTVLVSCFEDTETNIDLIKRVNPDRIQLGETEDPRLAEAIYNMDDRPKIAQVFHIGSHTTPSAMDDFMDHIDYAHFDTFDETKPGGTGRTHDWRRSHEMVLAAREAGKLTILAGGLRPDNVRKAIETVQPDGVDVESGIKDMRGAHDPLLVGRFVQAANAAFEAVGLVAV